jgi:hypothetical protein
VPSPRWSVGEKAQYWDYERCNVKRMHLGEVLRERPSDAAAFADRVLDAIVCDEDVSFNRQLIEPMIVAVGRRAVQEYLIEAVRMSAAPQKVCAVRAWYWSQPMLVYRSSSDLRKRRPTASSGAEADEVVDLRSWYREACLRAFVECDDVETRKWLARGFILSGAHYDPALGELVDRARAIAEADPVVFADLLAKTEDGTSLAALRPFDPE